jgi:hypothetical protein
MPFQGVEYEAGTIGYERVSEQCASCFYKSDRNFCPKAIIQPSSTEDIQMRISQLCIPAQNQLIKAVGSVMDPKKLEKITRWPIRHERLLGSILEHQGRAGV